MAANPPVNTSDPSTTAPEAPSSGLFQRSYGLGQVATFSRQLAVLLDAGIPMVRALKILGRRTSSGAMGGLVHRVTADVEAGGAFSTALQSHGEGLPGVVVPLMRAGEKAGELSQNLRYLADSLDHDAHMRSKVTTALMFPVITLAFAATVLLFILIVVAPMFMELLGESGAGGMPELNWLSRTVFGASQVLTSPMGITIVGVAALAFVLLIWRSMTHNSYLVDFLKIRMPFIGRMVATASMARFAKTLAALLRTGVPVLESLRLSRATVDNLAIEQAVVAMERSVESGGRMSAPLEEYWYIPELARDMIVIGEESGSMAEMLDNLAEVFRADVNRQQDQLVTLIEPLAILGVGFVVLIVLLGIFMPYFSLVMNVAVP